MSSIIWAAAALSIIEIAREPTVWGMASFADLVYGSFRLRQDVASQGHKSEPGLNPLGQGTA
jgi:hypothetical protein